MTTMIFVRHGQSFGNLEQRFMGQTETALTPLGHRQAQATADFLKAYKIDAIYSSDLSRAMQTAAPTALSQGVAVIPDKAFREINAGLWEGKPYSLLRKEFGEGYEQWLTDLGHAHPDGGESTQALAARVYDAVDRILEIERGKTVAVFTHATPVRMLACRWFGLSPEKAADVPFCRNASVSIVEYEDNGDFRLIRYGYEGSARGLLHQPPADPFYSSATLANKTL